MEYAALLYVFLVVIAVVIAFLIGRKIAKSCNSDETKYLFTDVKVEGDVKKVDKSSVGIKISMNDYMEKEWKTNTPVSQKMRAGYRDLRDVHKLRYIQRIRGDNYCALRSTGYQTLLNAREQLINSLGSENNMIKKCQQFNNNFPHIINEWSFGENLFPKNNYDKIMRCINNFYCLVDNLNAKKNDSERVEYLQTYLNSSYTDEIEILEAIKFFMMLAFSDLYAKHQSGASIPENLQLIFFRDTSANPYGFFKNHLDCVGKDGGLEQIEMILLAHTLGVKICVYRLSQHGKKDFVTYFTDDSKNDVKVDVVSEDDRHYNIVVP